jgi:hypothetical protein
VYISKFRAVAGREKEICEDQAISRAVSQLIRGQLVSKNSSLFSLSWLLRNYTKVKF